MRGILAITATVLLGTLLVVACSSSGVDPGASSGSPASNAQGTGASVSAGGGSRTNGTIQPGTDASTSPPHIVVFMIDDLDQRLFQRLLDNGYLPNINRFVVTPGVSFVNSFATDAICCPSRATFLSGQYVHNHGVLDITKGSAYLYPTDATGQGGESTMLPVWLQKRGYRTALFGKYLNGYGGETSTASTRVPQGWNRWVALEGNTTYNMYGYQYCAVDDATTCATHDTECCSLQTGGSTDADYQPDWIASQTSGYVGGLDPTTPQFIYVASSAPHTETNEGNLPAAFNYGATFQWNLPVASRYKYLVDGNTANGELPAQDTTIPNYNESDTTYAQKPGWMTQNVPPMDAVTEGWAASQYRHRAGAMLAVDDMVGTVLGAMDARGMLQNTVVIFTADNGYFLGEHRLAEKGAPYEEAIRVPLVVRSPGAVPGTTCGALAANHDMAVTIADFAGAATTGRVPDGRSLRSFLGAPSLAGTRKNILVEHYQEQGKGVFGIIWPYGTVRTVTGSANTMYSLFDTTQQNVIKSEYYDLLSDPYELHNTVANQSVVRLSVLNSQLSNLRSCIGSACTTDEDR